MIGWYSAVGGEWVWVGGWVGVGLGRYHILIGLEGVMGGWSVGGWGAGGLGRGDVCRGHSLCWG